MLKRRFCWIQIYILQQRDLSYELPGQSKREAYGKCIEACSGFHDSRAPRGPALVPDGVSTSLGAEGLLAVSENSLSL